MELKMKLIQLRKKKGITQLELAEHLHVSRQAVSRWEVGASIPSIDNLKLLAETYNVSVEYLLNGKQNSSEPVSPQLKSSDRDGSKIQIFLYIILTTQ